MSKNVGSDAKNQAANRFVGLWQVERKPDRRMEFRLSSVVNKLDALDRGSDGHRGDANGSALVQGDAITLRLASAPAPYHGRLVGSDRIEWSTSDLKSSRQRAWVRCKGLRRDGLKKGGWHSVSVARSRSSPGQPRVSSGPLRAPVVALSDDSKSTPAPASMLGWQVEVQGRLGTVRGWVRQTGMLAVQFGHDFEQVAADLVTPLPGQMPHQPPVRGWGSLAANRMMDDADGV